jgi:hypothetical protein
VAAPAANIAPQDLREQQPGLRGAVGKPGLGERRERRFQVRACGPNVRRRKATYAFSQLAIVPAMSPSQNCALANPKNASGISAASRTAEKTLHARRQSPAAMA